MDFSPFKGVICNCLIVLQYGLMAKTLKDSLEPEAPKSHQNVIYANKKFRGKRMHVFKQLKTESKIIWKKNPIYLKPLKSGFLLGKIQAMLLLFLPLNCKLPLWCSDFGQLDFTTVLTSSPVTSLCSLQVNK